MENALHALSTLLPAGNKTETSTSQENTTSSKDSSVLESSKTTSDVTSGPTTVGEGIDTTVDSEIAPAVEHTHVKKLHEEREQTHIEKERHQDHYHTTIQPLKDTEVLPEKHEYQQEKKEREINKDDGAARAKAEADRSGLQNTVDEEQFESKVKEPTDVEEHVHHHLHETIVPVIEKEVIVPSVTHKRIDVHEKITEPSQNHGITTNEAIPVEEFKAKIAGAKDVLPIQTKSGLNENSQSTSSSSTSKSDGSHNNKESETGLDVPKPDALQDGSIGKDNGETLGDDLSKLEQRAGDSAQGLKSQADSATSTAGSKADQSTNKAGQKTDELANKADNAASNAGDKADELSSKAGDKADQTANKASDLASQAGDKANEALEKAGNKVDELTGNKNTIS